MKIRLEDISLEFQGKVILDSLNMTLKPNLINCLLGSSGSGKTSLIKIIAGISPTYTGKVYFDKTDVSDLSAKERNVGWVPQSQLLFPNLTVYQNVEYALKARNFSQQQRKIRVAEITELTGIEHLIDRKPDKLSGGEKQRVALARALCPNPKILLLDEPFSSLDAPERDRMALVFREIQLETDVTSMHVTHSPREVELIGDHVHVLSEGKIIQDDETKNIFESPDSIQVAQLLNLENIIPANTFKDIDYDCIISEAGININTGSNKGKVLKQTRSHIYLLLDNHLKLKLIDKTNENLNVNEIINFEIDFDKINKIGN